MSKKKSEYTLELKIKIVDGWLNPKELELKKVIEEIEGHLDGKPLETVREAFFYKVEANEVISND